MFGCASNRREAGDWPVSKDLKGDVHQTGLSFPWWLFKWQRRNNWSQYLIKPLPRVRINTPNLQHPRSTATLTLAWTHVSSFCNQVPLHRWLLSNSQGPHCGTESQKRLSLHLCRNPFLGYLWHNKHCARIWGINKRMSRFYTILPWRIKNLIDMKMMLPSVVASY